MTAALDDVRRRFNKGSQSYDSVADVQKNTAHALVNKLITLPHFSPKTVLDAGTGTGYVVECLLPQYQQASFYLNDIAEAMLEICQTKFDNLPNVHYMPGDMLTLNENKYDCIISNLAIQWIDDWVSAVTFLHKKTIDVFAFSTLLNGTFQAWQDIICQYQPIHMLHYPEAHALIDLGDSLKKQNQGFEYWINEVSLSFDSPLAFMRYVQRLGASRVTECVHVGNLRKILKAPTQRITITYKIFFGIFRPLLI